MYRLAMCAAVLLTFGCTSRTSDDRAADVYVVHKKSGQLFNMSQHERDYAEADAILMTVRQALRKKTPEQLIAMFNLPDGRVREWFLAGSGYYVVRDGNEMIEAELRRRGNSAAPALERHREDATEIFTGSNGMEATVGEVCQSILNHQPPYLYYHEDPP
jgi:hypothetical protein